MGFVHMRRGPLQLAQYPSSADRPQNPLANAIIMNVRQYAAVFVYFTEAYFHNVEVFSASIGPSFYRISTVCEAQCTAFATHVLTFIRPHVLDSERPYNCLFFRVV